MMQLKAKQHPESSAIARPPHRNRHSTSDKTEFRPKKLPSGERDAAKLLAKELGKGFSDVNTGRQIDEDVAELIKGRRQNAATARRVVAGCYDRYLFYAGSKQKRQKLYRTCIDAGIELTAAMELPTVVVRFSLRAWPTKPKRELISRYVATIRQATLEQVPPGKLADHLSKKGCSIKAMAKKFAKRERKDEPAEPLQQTIKLQCSSEKLRKKIDQYRTEGGCWLRVKPGGSNSLFIDKVNRCPNPKSAKQRAS